MHLAGARWNARVGIRDLMPLSNVFFCMGVLARRFHRPRVHFSFSRFSRLCFPAEARLFRMRAEDERAAGMVCSGIVCAEELVRNRSGGCAETAMRMAAFVFLFE